MVFFVHMTEKEEQASPRTASPSLQIKDADGELRTEPVQEMLDSIDEVWRCQGPKVEFSCFFLRPRLSAKTFLLPPNLHRYSMD